MLSFGYALSALTNQQKPDTVPSQAKNVSGFSVGLISLAKSPKIIIQFRRFRLIPFLVHQFF